MLSQTPATQATQALQHHMMCMSCSSFMPASKRYCGDCGMKETLPVTQAEVDSTAHALIRFRELMLTSKSVATEKHHKRTLTNFTDFLAAIGKQPTNANPYNCMAFLMSKDKGARELLHNPTCSQKNTSNKKNPTCGCPLRAKSTSVDTTIGWLTAVLNDLGLTGEYDARNGSGNPCKSSVVRAYNKTTALEQNRLGEFPHQAPVFDVAIFNRMLAYCLSKASASSTLADRADELKWLQTAFMFSLLYNTINRGNNIVDLTWDQLEVTSLPNGDDVLHVRCDPSKTTGPRGVRHAVALPAGTTTLGDFHPITLFKLMVNLTNSDDLEYGARKGYVFRKHPTDFSSHLTTQTLYSRLTEVSFALGISHWRITIHSFRASGAIAAIFAGESPQVIMYKAGWSNQEMMHYYTYLRQILGLSDADLEPPARLPQLQPPRTEQVAPTLSPLVGAIHTRLPPIMPGPRPAAPTGSRGRGRGLARL